MAIADPYQRKRKEQRIAAALERLGGVCANCGTAESLEFDHVDPETKLYVIRKNGWCQRKEVFWTEVDKCQLLCTPCHKEKSEREGDLKYRYREECKKGHAFTPENTGIRPERSGRHAGQRFCKECQREYARAAYQRSRDRGGRSVPDAREKGPG